ncbi:MAG: hypothetical protein PHR00_02955 [Patescibacteria group bacterium]|nr:hypothetical protein [Patescibacteria group bacterium]
MIKISNIKFQLIAKDLSVDKRGFSIAEVLVAGTVFTMVMAAVCSLLYIANDSSRQSVERTKALYLAKEGIEATRSIRDINFNNLTVGSHGVKIINDVWQFSDTSDNTDGYVREINIQDVDSRTKLVKSTVNWAVNGKRQEDLFLTTYLTKWEPAGQSSYLNIDYSAARSSGTKEVVGIRLKNTNSTALTITQVQVYSTNNVTINRIMINGSSRWTGSASSGTLININDYRIPAYGNYELRLRYNGSVRGYDYKVAIYLSDGTIAKSVFFYVN